mgnify:CR=1 FL=1
MAQTIKLKRSAVSGNTPSTSDLELGEIAINTYDGKVFIKKNDGSASVVEVGAADNTKLPLTGGTITGTVVFNSAPTFNTAIAMGSTLNVASSIGIAGTTVIDSSRNLTNIGSISTSSTIASGSTIHRGNLTIDSQEIDVSSGDLTLDVAGDIILDADGAQVRMKDDGTERFTFNLDATPEIDVAGGDFTIHNTTSDADIIFTGNDLSLIHI